MDSQASIRRTLRRLTLAVWVLAFLVGALLILVGFGVALVTGMFASSPTVVYSPSSAAVTDPHPVERWDFKRYEGFHDWPLAKQVAEASVILVTRYDDSGDEMKEVIAEVLKQTPEAYTSFKVGDAFDKPGSARKDYMGYKPSGRFVFMVDSPARFSYSTTYDESEGERPGMLGVTRAQLRAVVQDSLKPEQGQRASR